MPSERKRKLLFKYTSFCSVPGSRVRVHESGFTSPGLRVRVYESDSRFRSVPYSIRPLTCTQMYRSHSYYRPGWRAMAGLLTACKRTCVCCFKVVQWIPVVFVSAVIIWGYYVYVFEMNISGNKDIKLLAICVVLLCLQTSKPEPWVPPDLRVSGYSHS